MSLFLSIRNTLCDPEVPGAFFPLSLSLAERLPLFPGLFLLLYFVSKTIEATFSFFVAECPRRLSFLPLSLGVTH